MVASIPPAWPTLERVWDQAHFARTLLRILRPAVLMLWALTAIVGVHTYLYCKQVRHDIVSPPLDSSHRDQIARLDVRRMVVIGWVLVSPRLNRDLESLREQLAAELDTTLAPARRYKHEIYEYTESGSNFPSARDGCERIEACERDWEKAAPPWLSDTALSEQFAAAMHSAEGSVWTAEQSGKRPKLSPLPLSVERELPAEDTDAR